MAFNPFDEKGIPLEKQTMGWGELNVQPYPAHGVPPYTRCRIILMNGAEVEAAIFLHQFARHTEDLELKRHQALARRAEQEQQKMVNWLIPAHESVLEVTIGYEQVAVDLTAWLARTEPDPYVKAALDFALLEDFDHLYRYANLMELEHGEKAERLVGDYTEIMPGRPTIAEHRHPFDDVRRFTDFDSAELITKLHIMTIVPAEQQTMNFYMNAGNRYMSPLGRGLYLEIAQVEEQHVTHYESLADPRVLWMERWVMHDYNEAYLYYSCMETETEPRIKDIWAHLLDMEIGHLQADRKLMQKYENKDPVDMFPAGFPELTVFQSNKDYVREVLENQVHLTANEVEYVPVGDLPRDHRFFKHQEMVNAGPWVPSQEAIRREIQNRGMDYRWTPDGEHPVKDLRVRDEMPPKVAR